MAPEMDILAIQRMTMADFEVMARAYELRQVDEMFMASYQAWQISQAQASDKKGHPIHKKFRSLFDYEDTLRKVKKGDAPEKTIKNRTALELAAKANRKAGESKA